MNKTITDEITSVNEALDSGLAQANKGVQEAKSAVADANKQIATVNKSLTDSITRKTVSHRYGCGNQRHHRPGDCPGQQNAGRRRCRIECADKDC